MIEAQDPGKPAEFATVLSRWITPLGVPLPPKLMTNPTQVRLDGRLKARITWGRLSRM